MIPRLLNLLSATSLVSGITFSATNTALLANLSASDATAYAQADAGIQLVFGVLMITLGFFLHALARMRRGERPVHITVKPKAKRRMWYWVDMRI